VIGGLWALGVVAEVVVFIVMHRLGAAVASAVALAVVWRLVLVPASLPAPEKAQLPLQ
jgi:hypothetical protein